ncbi:MAG: hypothetical protein HQL28_04415, partial [Candidatus Omnitrophica bacterium]|nr:hypothetical protein [Candidatus Omnitrophota bacterium]
TRTLTIDGDVTIDGPLTVDGDVLINGAVTFTGNAILNVTGSITLNSTISNGNVTTSCGTISMVSSGNVSTTSSGTLNIGTQSSGFINATSGFIVMSGTPVVQNFTTGSVFDAGSTLTITAQAVRVPDTSRYSDSMIALSRLQDLRKEAGLTNGGFFAVESVNADEEEYVFDFLQ